MDKREIGEHPDCLLVGKGFSKKGLESLQKQ